MTEHDLPPEADEQAEAEERIEGTRSGGAVLPSTPAPPPAAAPMAPKGAFDLGLQQLAGEESDLPERGLFSLLRRRRRKRQG
jgi:hypothetical protein